MPMASHAPDVLDLGIIDAPLLVFGGPYSNAQATHAMLDVARKRGFAPDHIICTGDVVAYCANPHETTQAIRDAGIHVVMGNCEESLGFDQDDCGCGFDADSACDVLSRQWFSYARTRLDENARAWMRDLPRRITASVSGRRLSFIHGSTDDISGWVFASSSPALKVAQFDALSRADEFPSDAIIAGHCGLPFSDVLEDGRLWHNAGVIGMPANDATQRGWFSVIEPDPAHEGALLIQTQALDYDAAAAASAMRETRLAEGYASALESGLWPNMDVLEAPERAAQGIALEPNTLLWDATTRRVA